MHRAQPRSSTGLVIQNGTGRLLQNGTPPRRARKGSRRRPRCEGRSGYRGGGQNGVRGPGEGFLGMFYALPPSLLILPPSPRPTSRQLTPPPSTRDKKAPQAEARRARYPVLIAVAAYPLPREPVHQQQHSEREPHQCSDSACHGALSTLRASRHPRSLASL